MTREDLFLAIGDVEENRLAHSEAMAPSDDAHWEDAEMSKQEYRKRGSIFRGLLIAAIVVTMLATTAFAYTGFVVYENPQAMLDAFFGEQPEPHGPDCLCADCTVTVPTHERAPLNEDTAMAEVAPYISEIGDPVTDECMGYRLTVEAYTYDAATGCGLVYYTLENYDSEYPIDYNLQENGEIWGISPSSNHPCKEYLVASESTATKLKIACYFIRAEGWDDYFRIGFNGLIREGIDEEVEDYIILPFESNEMKSLSLEEGKIILSPIGLVVKGELPCVQKEGSSEPKINRVVIRYTDGTEYLIVNEDDDNCTYNFAYSLMNLQGEVQLTYALNRVVDLDNLSAVIINGTEFLVD